MPRAAGHADRDWIRDVADAIAVELEERGRFVLELEAEPSPANARLLEALGVEVRLTLQKGEAPSRLGASDTTIIHPDKA